VDADALRQSLAEAVTGIYCGWASIGASPRVRACVRACMRALRAAPVATSHVRGQRPWVAASHVCAMTPNTACSMHPIHSYACAHDAHVSAQVYKMCMSIGWNPFYGNQHKTAEPWILHTFEQVLGVFVYGLLRALVADKCGHCLLSLPAAMRLKE
jgi:hypothetical protein